MITIKMTPSTTSRSLPTANPLSTRCGGKLVANFAPPLFTNV